MATFFFAVQRAEMFPEIEHVTLPSTPTGASENHDTTFERAFTVDSERGVKGVEVSINNHLSAREIAPVHKDLKLNVMVADEDIRRDCGVVDCPLPPGSILSSTVLETTDKVYVQATVYVHYIVNEEEPDFDDVDVVIAKYRFPLRTIQRLEIRVKSAVFVDAHGSIIIAVSDETRGSSTDMFLKCFVKRCLAERYTKQIQEFQRAGLVGAERCYETVNIVAWHPALYVDECDGKSANKYKTIVLLNHISAGSMCCRS